MTGPVVHPLYGRSRVLRALGPWFCRRWGCSWEVRRGYDWCPRCGTAEWHLVRSLAA